MPATAAVPCSFAITPAAAGRQLVRLSLPCPAGLLPAHQGLSVSDGRRTWEAGVRVLTRHPDGSARRAMVTFPYTFTRKTSVRFAAQPGEGSVGKPALPVGVELGTGQVVVRYRKGPTFTARLIAPPGAASRTGANGSGDPTTNGETVESNPFYLWRRLRVPDPAWPRVIEVRADALGGVVIVAHVQRGMPGERAPELGWEVAMDGRSPSPQPSPLGGGGEHGPAAPPPPPQGRGQGEGLLPLIARLESTQATPGLHSFEAGEPCSVVVGEGSNAYRLYHPAAPLKRRGRVELGTGPAFSYRYLRCTAEDRVPMQEASWQRVELVIAPAGRALLTPTLEEPHAVAVDGRLWRDLYGVMPTPKLPAELAAAVEYHHQAVRRSMCLGDDWGNVTSYSDSLQSGPVYGMNRLNHCPAIFEEAWRTGDRGLREVALLWCDNFFDQSIWWGLPQAGGTRYNNQTGLHQTPPDDKYMWRSNMAVSFCTKGYDSFLMAYEETGDPRLLEAMQVQVRYAKRFIHADQGECRNVGDARDFVRLYEMTGDRTYLDEAMRLFRELRNKLSTGNLFDQGGKPLDPDPPFIEEDARGLKQGYAKPYIIGYALAGLPGLARYCPGEPKLRDTIQAVADFLADSQDPVGGWRYPHPRSSTLIMNQAMEHAWQLVQADRFLGPQPRHLDAIERVLRQRLLAWQQTGFMFGGLTGWEYATGKVKAQAEMYRLYQRPADRDPARDWAEGRPDLGYCAPEGIVYFPEVLAFYLEHRPVERLLAPAPPDSPLGQVLARIPPRAK